VRGRIQHGIVLVVILALIASCATKPYIQKEDKILGLVDAINGGQVAEKGLAEPPFLFDGEIILMQNHLSALWNNLYMAGFRLRDAAVARNERLNDDSYLFFADTMEARTFFRKYLDMHTSFVEIKARDGSYYLLLNKEVNGYPRIQGMKGPVR
jgi:hypothetical protein